MNAYPMRRAAGAAAGIALAAASLLASAPAHALFSDDEARKAIIELRGRVELQNRETNRKLQELSALVEERGARLERLEQTVRGQLELQSQIEALRQEIAKLRGQLEVQTNELAQTQRRQREVFAEIDSRIKPFEPVQVQLDGKTVNVDPEERRTFEGALSQFRSGEFTASIASFQQLRSRWPQSPYIPNALFWIGSAQFALKDYKAAIAAQQQLLARFPEHPRAVDAMLNLGAAQAEGGDKRAARKTFETLLDKHPDTQAAQLAKERLAALR